MASRRQVRSWAFIAGADDPDCNCELHPRVVEMADMLERAASIIARASIPLAVVAHDPEVKAWLREWRGDSPSETDESGATSPSGADDA